jgi:hypothetical protein
MNVWHRADADAPPAAVVPSRSRALRNRLRGLLAEPDVREKTIVVYARRGFPKRSSWAGMFSEFHSVLGALKYAELHGAVGVRVDFRSPLYLDEGRGPNWWSAFFEPTLMPIEGRASQGEVHLNRVAAKYGQHGGFCDLVNGTTPYLYPMTYGVSRAELHRLLTTYVHVRPEIRDEASRFIAARVEPGAFVVGVHYRGTDSTHGVAGRFADYRTTRVPYDLYIDEVRRALRGAPAREHQVLVATDEIEFLERARREFGDRVLFTSDAPRVHAGAEAIHLDRSLPVSNYQKGKSGLVDCLLLASTHYLVKGRSNLSDASLAFNPRLPYSFCVR